MEKTVSNNATKIDFTTIISIRSRKCSWKVRVRYFYGFSTFLQTHMCLSCRSGRQRGPDGAGQDSHHGGLCRCQVHSGHWPHTGVPGQEHFITFLSLVWFHFTEITSNVLNSILDLVVHKTVMVPTLSLHPGLLSGGSGLRHQRMLRTCN